MHSRSYFPSACHTGSLVRSSLRLVLGQQSQDHRAVWALSLVIVVVANCRLLREPYNFPKTLLGFSWSLLADNVKITLPRITERLRILLLYPWRKAREKNVAASMYFSGSPRESLQRNTVGLNSTTFFCNLALGRCMFDVTDGRVSYSPGWSMVKLG